MQVEMERRHPPKLRICIFLRPTAACPQLNLEAASPVALRIV
jgi:hypothetical protein